MTSPHTNGLPPNSRLTSPQSDFLPLGSRHPGFLGIAKRAPCFDLPQNTLFLFPSIPPASTQSSTSASTQSSTSAHTMLLLRRFSRLPLSHQGSLSPSAPYILLKNTHHAEVSVQRQACLRKDVVMGEGW